MSYSKSAGLSRIILVNSYIDSSQNGLFEFNFNNHTQINGANGSGKTSLLKLIPFFYGLEPGRITSSSNVKKSFAGYYLPFADSAIIFEYFNHLGQLVHVIITNAANNPNSKMLSYRFVPYAFENLDYIIVDENSGKYRARTWTEYKTILREKHPDFRLEAQVNSIDQYRSIIQNINLNGNNNLRNQYSLSSGRKELRYIESITHSLITGHVSFENIKLLLTEILKRDHQNINLELKESDITDWCKDVNAFRAIENKKNLLLLVSTETQNLQNDYKSLLNQGNNLHWYEGELKDEISSLKDEYNEKISNREAFLKQTTSKQIDLTQVCTEAQSKLDEQIRSVKNYEIKQSEYDEKKAPYWSSRIKQQYLVEENLAKHEQMLASITSEYNDIKAEFDSLKAKAKASYSDQNAICNEKISQIQKDKSDKLHELENRFNINKSKNDKDKNERINTVKLDLRTIAENQKHVEYEIKHVSAPEELLIQEKEISLALKQIFAEVHTKEQELRKATKEKVAKENEKQSLVAIAKNIKTESEQAYSRLQYLAKILNPDINILTGYLNENIPNWHNSIGLVIKEDLLSRNDLDPQLLEIESTYDQRITIGNLSLSTKKLISIQQDNSYLLNEQAELNTKIDKLKSQERENKQKIIEIENDLALLNSNITNLEGLVYKDEEINQLNERENIVKHKIEAAKNSALAELTENKNSLIRQEKELHNSINNITKEFAELNNSLTDTYLTNKSDIETSFDNELELLHEQKIKVETQYKDAIKNYDNIMKSRLNKNNIDDALIDKMDNEVKQCKKELQDIINNKMLVVEYEMWFETFGKYINDEREKVDELRNVLNEKKANLTQYIQYIKKQTDILQKNITTCETTIKNKVTSYQNVVTINKELHDYNITITYNRESKPEISVENLIKDCETTLSRYKENKAALKFNLEKIDNCMSENRSSTIYAFWNQAKDRQTSDLRFSPNESEDDITLKLKANAANILINSMPVQKRTLLDHAHNITHMINEYYYHLRDFDNRIKGFSNRISSIVTGNLQFEAFEQFNIQLEPCIKKLAGWEFIEDIAKYSHKWDDENANQGELPDTNFTDKLNSLADKFVNGQLHNEISDLFSIVFEVTENGKQKKATTARELEDLSSNGLTFLLICALYISLIQESRNSQDIIIHWPVDEMSKLSNKNILLLLKIMDNNLIKMVSAAPDLSTSVATNFNNIYRITKDKVYVNKEPKDPLQNVINQLMGV
jgi:hypothetical protein